METQKIFSDTLGETTKEDAEKFAEFCTAVASAAGHEIRFAIDYKTSGYQPDSLGKRISNTCWEVDWYRYDGTENCPVLKSAVSRIDTHGLGDN